MREITNAEVAAGIIFSIAFFFLHAILIWVNVFISPGLGTLGAWGFAIAWSFGFGVLSIVVLGFVGHNRTADTLALTGLWIVVGLFALMLGFYSLSYFVVGTILVIAASAIAAWVREQM